MVLPSICLTMIVKNESLIIKRLLDSVLPIIDSFLICDTGSTDNTIEIIKDYFNTNNITGKIIQEPFRDFAYNRSFALKASESVPNSDFILLLDADMILQINIGVVELKTRLLTHDAFYIFQGSPQFYYKNVRIIKNRFGCYYWGTTHEYMKTPEGTLYDIFNTNDIFINDIGDGGCKSDKCDRDIRLLTKGLDDNPNNDRYIFYLANSYSDNGDNEKAIELYKQRIELGGWIEEVWQSHFCIGKCFKRMGNNEMAIYSWLEAYNSFPNRIENLYEIVKYYRIQGNNELAYTFYMLADYERKKHSTWDYLFLQKDIYDYKLDYELSIIGYYCNRDQHNLANVSMKVLASASSDDINVLSNYKFYTDQLSKYAIPMDAITQKNLYEIGKEMNLGQDEFVSSTPSMCMHNGELVVCVRYVNYRINDSGNYLNQETIKTKNIIARFDISTPSWKKIQECEMPYDTTHDGRYVGPEDVRLFSTRRDGFECILYNANRGIGQDKMCIEHGIIQPFNDSFLLEYDGKSHEIEKNWVLFGDSINNKYQRGIYSFGPLIIGEIVSNTFKKTNILNVVPPFFKYVRGSTNGVKIGDEYWFICHVVSYEEDCRYYYHIMIVLGDDYSIKGYTPLWTFEKEKVEYTLGFVYFPDKNQFLIGYSIRDSKTKYIMISKQWFDDRMINI